MHSHIIIQQYWMGNKTTQSNKKQVTQAQSTTQSKGRAQRFKQQAVIQDQDDDRKVLEQADTIPFIGLIRGKFKSDQQTYIGTGIIISENLVLTSAHNVCKINSKQFKRYRSEIQKELLKTAFQQSVSADQNISQLTHVQFAQWIQFYPGINGAMKGFQSKYDTVYKRNKEQNYYKIKNYKVHPSYLTDFNNKRYDLCVLHLEKSVKLRQNIKILQDYRDVKTQISVYGYPFDQCFKEQTNTIKVQQVGAKGRFQLDQDSGLINYKIPTQIGQSGSPIFINTTNNGKPQYFCIGIHRGSDKKTGANASKNIGVHLNQEKLQFIVEAEESMTGKLSKIKTIKFPKLPQSNIAVLPQKNLRQKSLEQYQLQIQKAENKGGKLPRLIIFYYRQAALICLSLQNYKKAIIYYEKFIKAIEQLQQQTINEDDEDEYIIALINLAKSYCQQGQYETSYSLYEKSQKKCKQFFTLSIEKESTILNNKGAVLVYLGKYQEALQNFKTSYQLRKNKFGEENLMTYNSLQNLTSMKFKLSINLDECLSDYEKVFKFKQKKFGLGSPQAFKSKLNIAVVLFELKKYYQSLQAFYFCFQKFSNLDQNKNKSLHNDFTKQFIKYMRQLCKSQCSLKDLKFAFHMCEKYALSNISKELEDQWSKRKMIQEK